MQPETSTQCTVCHLIVQIPAPELDSTGLACPRCDSHLALRKPGSISTTWALLIASFICYIPANILPMTRTSYFGGTQEDTILSGVIYFIESGSWHVAMIIFVASIVVPLAKMIILAYLLISVQQGSSYRKHDRTRLYRMTRLIGRWSMIDLYVVATVASLVQLKVLSTVEAGSAAFFFAAVVALTLIAAETFDPRLIWDDAEKIHAP